MANLSYCDHMSIVYLLLDYAFICVAGTYPMNDQVSIELKKDKRGYNVIVEYETQF